MRGALKPLPDELCNMGQLFRDVYTVEDPVIEKAAVPILMKHRDFIYERHLELPVDLRTWDGLSEAHQTRHG